MINYLYLQSIAESIGKMVEADVTDMDKTQTKFVGHKNGIGNK